MPRPPCRGGLSCTPGLELAGSDLSADSEPRGPTGRRGRRARRRRDRAAHGAADGGPSHARALGSTSAGSGFLADLTPAEFRDRLADLAARQYTVENLMTLECTLTPADGPDPDLPRPQRRGDPRRADLPPGGDRPVDRRRERDDLPRRRPDHRHAGRLDGAQPLGGRADPAAERPHVRRHADCARTR